MASYTLSLFETHLSQAVKIFVRGEFAQTTTRQRLLPTRENRKNKCYVYYWFKTQNNRAARVERTWYISVPRSVKNRE